MNKKAVIGTTMTWIVALCILVFIMIIFLVLVSSYYLSFKKYSFSVDEPDVFAPNKINSLEGFFKANRQEVSAWADNEVVLGPFDIDPGHISDDKISALKDFEILCRKLKKFAEFTGMEKPRICLESDSENGMKTISVNAGEAGIECSIESICSKEAKIKMFFISENGNLIRVYYSDETNFKLGGETFD